MSKYEELAKINVNEHVDKKNGLSYLSWAWAWDQLMRADPAASVIYHEPQKFGKETYMVSCTVTAFGVERKMHLPVMDYKNKAISDPDAFAFNTAMQRCLVKAIALHGLGLYIYAGEDLPDGEEEKHKSKITPTAGAFEAQPEDMQIFLIDLGKEVSCLVNDGEVSQAYELIESKEFDADQKVALWSRLDSKVRSTLKKHADSVKHTQ